jgi:hypothetical protein
MFRKKVLAYGNSKDGQNGIPPNLHTWFIANSETAARSL